MPPVTLPALLTPDQLTTARMRLGASWLEGFSPETEVRLEQIGRALEDDPEVATEMVDSLAQALAVCRQLRNAAPGQP